MQLRYSVFQEDSQRVIDVEVVGIHFYRVFRKGLSRCYGAGQELVLARGVLQESPDHRVGARRGLEEADGVDH